jgi:hypothetical protein
LTVTVDRSQRQADFFISYNHADKGWAEWVAWALEEEGYKTVLQAWDFRPGSNFVVQMHEAAQLSKQTIAILSPNYLGSQYSEAEWAAAFAEDPVGHDRGLIPVRIAPTVVDGLLGQIVWIDLVGLDRPSAKAALIAGLSPGRAKPVTEPLFPGPASTGGSSVDTLRMKIDTARLDWHPLAQEAAAVWRNEIVAQSNQYSSIFELHMIPAPPQRLEVRRLSHMGEELATIGRSAGLFSSVQGIAVEANDRYAYAKSQPGRQQDEVGLAVTRAGQRSTWMNLPHDSMGSVFDPSDLQPRLTALIKLLGSISLPESERVAFALRVEPLALLSIGDASTVGHRSRTKMPFASRNSCTVAPEDTLALGSVRAYGSEVAEELTERLAAALRST